jgi:hypothetical protein
MAGQVLVRNRAPANWPRESVEDGNDQLDGDQTLDNPPRVRDGRRF